MRSVGRVGRALGLAIVVAGGVLCVLAVARQVTAAFCFISIGGLAIDLFSPFEVWLQGLGLRPPDGEAVVMAAILAVPAMAFLASRCYRAGGWPSALMATMLPALGVWLALSYRLPALVGAGVLAWSLRTWPRDRRPRPASWAVLFLSAALGSIPVDVSLRVRPHGPRCAPTVTGCPSGNTLDADDRGDLVFINYMLLNPSKCTWVW